MGTPSTQTSCVTSCHISSISCGNQKWIQQYVYYDARVSGACSSEAAVLADLDGVLHGFFFSASHPSSLLTLSFLPFLDLLADS